MSLTEEYTYKIHHLRWPEKTRQQERSVFNLSVVSLDRRHKLVFLSGDLNALMFIFLQKLQEIAPDFEVHKGHKQKKGTA